MAKHLSACLLAEESVVVGNWWEVENESKRITLYDTSVVVVVVVVVRRMACMYHSLF